MRRPLLSLALAAIAVLVTSSRSEAALITFDLNAPDAAFQGMAAPYATVTVSTQGTGTAHFSVVADGPYSINSIFFQIDPATLFQAPGKPVVTGGVAFPGLEMFDPTPLAIGGNGVGLIDTDQFGAFGFGYKSSFGTVKSLNFDLIGAFPAVIAAVIRPNAQGFLAAGQFYNGDVAGFVGGNGSPTPVTTAVPEPATLALFLPALLILGLGLRRAKARRSKRQGSKPRGIDAATRFFPTGGWRTLPRLAAIAVTAALATVAPGVARANVITSFAFNLFGPAWTNSPPFVPELIVNFSGAIEPSGYLNLADLNTFGLTFVDGYPLPFPVTVFAGFAGLSHFSYNPSLGAASLDFVETRVNPEATYTICFGLSAAFSPVCNPGNLPGAFDADVLVDGAFYAGATALPDIQNLGSVTTGGGTGVTAVPEPSPWGAMILGLGLIGYGVYRRRTASRG